MGESTGQTRPCKNFPVFPIGVGYAHRGTKILAIADDPNVSVTNLVTGEILSTHAIEPDKHYWCTTQRAPGRWPGAL